MSIIVPRTCTEISSKRMRISIGRRNPSFSKQFRDTPAYVLLGDPGAGKTTAFEAECEALGERAYSRVITADEFLTYDVSDLPPEWREKTLFIDGLDEVRAGAQGASEFRELRKRLRALGKLRFRLSCRQADWLGTYDQGRLRIRIARFQGEGAAPRSPDSSVTSRTFLNARSDIPDAGTFIKIRRREGSKRTTRQSPKP